MGEKEVSELRITCPGLSVEGEVQPSLLESCIVSSMFYPQMDHNHFLQNAAAMKYSHHGGRGQQSTDQQDNILQLVREGDRKEGM